jgi:hypothetical protein
MKQTAKLALLTLFLVVVLPASAVVTCHVVTQGGWPGGQYTQYCGTASESNGTDMYQMLNILQSYAPNAFAEFEKHNSPFYLFHDFAEFHENFPNVAAPSNYVFNFTVYKGKTSTPEYSVVLEVNELGQDNQYIGHATAVQAGLWTYYFYGSEAHLEADELSVDWSALNLLSNCGSNNNPLGLFTGYAADTGVYICTGDFGQGHSLRSGFSGTNQNVLDVAWPFVFKNEDDVWAEQMATTTGFTDGFNTGNAASVDGYFQNSNFQCTRTVVYYAIVFGETPPKYAWPVGCPTS